MNMAFSSLLRWRPVWFTLLLVIALAGYQAWIAVGAAAKLAAADLAKVNGRVDVSVTMNIDPEQFHMIVLQDTGRLVRAQGRRAYLRDVAAAELRALASRYWVARLERWDGS